jgi:hypothetical protein
MSTENPYLSTDEFEAEYRHIFSRQTGKAPDEMNYEDGENVKGTLVGLALSGGGIRSATFGLGVLEGLKSHGLLEKIGYLSTVSGGGYIGAWLSANCKRAVERKNVVNKCLKNPNEPIDPNYAEAYTGDKKKFVDASEDWLNKQANWTESIRHLRRYSNYLSPKMGFLSADSWSMAAVWIRNTLLVQLTVIFAIALLLLLPRLLFYGFKIWPLVGILRWTTVVLFVLAIAGIAGNQWQLNKNIHVPFLRSECWAGGLAAAILCLGIAVGLGLQFDFDPFTNDRINWFVAAPVSFFLVLTGFCLLPTAVKLIGFIGIKSHIWRKDDAPQRINYSQGWVQALVVIPIMVTGYLLAAVLWGQTTGEQTPNEFKMLDSFSGIFMLAWRYWPFPLSVALVSLWLISWFSKREGKMGLFIALVAPIPAVMVLYVLLCAIILMMHGWAHPQPKVMLQADPYEGIWLAFIWAPAMVLYAFSLAIVMLIGMMGRQSTEPGREWWSRLGAWLGIYGFAWMVIAVAAVYGPKWAALILDSGTWKGTSVIVGWLVTTLAGLFAGKSDLTGGVRQMAKSEKTTTKKLLDLFATVVPFIFIAGLFIGISTGLHLILLSISGKDWGWDAVSDLHLRHWEYMSGSPDTVVWLLVTAFACLFLLAWRVDINEFSLNAFYRSRLSRCYLGAARFLAGERSPQKFTEFDENDDMRLADLGRIDDQKRPVGPLHIVNCALNLGGSSDLALHTRHCASFTLTPYAVGSSYLSKDPSTEVRVPLGYQPIDKYGGRDNQPTLAQAISISGAAASPNMGYHTSPMVAFLLTVFNVRLGWWFPNPKKSLKSSSPWFSLRYLVKELFGGADDKSNYLMISDGGHFENLAAYELIRRQCRLIIISDAECDPELKFEGLARLIRMCKLDFGTDIRINDVNNIRLKTKSNWSRFRFAVGRIDYGNDKSGVLIYLKASMNGSEDTAIRQYLDSHPEFPHESTSDQFYDEDQFDSYRRLGREVAGSAFKLFNGKTDFMAIADEFLEKFPPPSKIGV